MRPMLDVHPEAAHGEVFLGNFTDAAYPLCGWPSKRRGRTAYDVKNNIVIGARPVFVYHSELQASGQLGNAVYRRKILGDDGIDSAPMEQKQETK